MIEITHQEMVARLVKPGEEILTSLTQDVAHLSHMAVGISGEAAELLDAILKATAEGQALDSINVVEELGDLEFYLEGLRAPLNLSRETAYWPLIPNDLVDPLTYMAAKIAIHSGEVLDAIKKHAIYVTVIDLELITAALGQIEKFMEALRNYLDILREECLATNIYKLRIRYENLAYSDKQAQERADKSPL